MKEDMPYSSIATTKLAFIEFRVRIQYVCREKENILKFLGGTLFKLGS